MEQGCSCAYLMLIEIRWRSSWSNSRNPEFEAQWKRRSYPLAQDLCIDLQIWRNIAARGIIGGFPKTTTPDIHPGSHSDIWFELRNRALDPLHGVYSTGCIAGSEEVRNAVSIRTSLDLRKTDHEEARASLP